MATATFDQILAAKPETGATLATGDIILSQDVSAGRTEGYTIAEFIIGLLLLGDIAKASDLIAHITDTVGAHTAGAVSVDSTSVIGTGTDLQTVLQDLTAAISAAGIPATIFDATGDLIVASAADTAARLAIGAANSVLSSNASAVLAWQAPRAIPKATVADTSTAYTAVLTDAGKQTTLSNGAAITYTIPPNASVAFATGTEIEIVQIGAGQVTVAAGAGVTITQPPGMTLAMVGQYSSAVATKTGTNTWRVEGDFVTRTRTVWQEKVSDPGGSAISTGDSKAYSRIPNTLSGYDLTGVAASVSTASSSGIVTVQIHRLRGGVSVDMLTTKVTIDANEVDSGTAVAAFAINTSNDDLATGDQLHIDIDVAGTGAKGLIVEFQAELMAVTLTLVDDVGTGGDAFGLAYPSLAYAASKVYFLSAVMRTSTGSPDIPVPSLTNGAFTILTTGLHPDSANRRFCVWMFTVSVDTTAILTVASSLSLSTQIGSHLVDGTGHNTTLPLAQTRRRGDQALNVSPTFTITADNATVAGNAMLWMSGHDGYSQTPGTGFTQLADTIGAPETSEFTQWRATGDQTAEAVAPGADGYGSGLLIEITVDPGTSTSWRPNTVWFNQT